MEGWRSSFWQKVNFEKFYISENFDVFWHKKQLSASAKSLTINLGGTFGNP